MKKFLLVSELSETSVCNGRESESRLWPREPSSSSRRSCQLHP